MEILLRASGSVFRTDASILLGFTLTSLCVLLIAHQFGFFEIGLRELPIVKVDQEAGQAARVFYDNKSPDNTLNKDLGVIVFKNGNKLTQTLEPNFVRRTPDTFSIIHDSILVSSDENEKGALASIANIKVYQPIESPNWLFHVLFVSGMLCLILGAVQSIARQIKTKTKFQIASSSVQGQPTVSGASWKAIDWGMTIAALLGGWLSMGHLIREADEQFDRSEFAVKLEMAKAEQEFPSCVFIGSSRTAYHTNPEIFENIIAQAGVETTAFNLGYPAGKAKELPMVLSDIFRADRKHRLEYVFIQLEDFNREYDDTRIKSKQAIRAHDVSSVSLLIGHYFDKDDFSLLQQLQFAKRRLSAFWHRQNNLGFGSEALDRWVDDSSENQKLEKRLAKYNKGFKPLVRKSGVNLSQVKAIEKMLKENGNDQLLPKAKHQLFPDFVASRKLIRMICEQVRDHGAIPVFVETPPCRNESVLAAYREGEIEHLIQLNDEERYPELFLLANYFDFAHLNDEGSNVFSKNLANEFVKIEREVVNVANQRKSQQSFR